MKGRGSEWSARSRGATEKPVMSTRVSCSRESIVFYGLFSGLRCFIIIMLYSSRSFFVVVAIGSVRV